MTLIKVIASVKGVSNLVSAKTETTEKLLRHHKTALNGYTMLMKVVANK